MMADGSGKRSLFVNFPLSTIDQDKVVALTLSLG
jgi:hypothetical protein